MWTSEDTMLRAGELVAHRFALTGLNGTRPNGVFPNRRSESRFLPSPVGLRQGIKSDRLKPHEV